MNFNSNTPIYIQIMGEFKKNIVSQQFALGSKVSSVRDLAIEYGVNPNTVQRALSELEREGLLRSERTSGRYICDDPELVDKLKITLAKEVVQTFLTDMKSLGFSDIDVLRILEDKQNNQEKSS